MPKEREQYKEVVNEFSKGMHTDNHPVNQPPNTHRFALNMVDRTTDGQENSKSNEQSNYRSTYQTRGFYPIGDRYMEDDLIAVILVNPADGGEEIGFIDKAYKYTPVVQTRVLGLSIRNQCDIIYRLRRGANKVIYWVDAHNKPRTFNFSKPYDFYNVTYINYLKGGGNPATFVGEKWDSSSFDLIKSYASVPYFSTVEILETGNIKPGSYNFAIQYVDQDLNPTEWISTSNTVNIFNDSITSSYDRIRGSRGNITQSQQFPKASKSIRLQITSLDQNYPYYRIAIIGASEGTGTTNAKALASDLHSTRDPTFTYAGNDSELTEVALADILIEKEIIFSPDHIEQLENRLILANTEGKNIDWCEFQKYASKIRTDLTTKQVILNSVDSKPNIKNSNSTFIYGGYMPGEVYSEGIAYLFDDGYISPVFHIPGRNLADTTSQMLYHEIDSKYLDIHNCITSDYWGKDYIGQTLNNRKVRHHRFPFRKDVNKPLVTTSGTNFTITRYRLFITISLNPDWTPGPIEYPKDGDDFPLDIDYQFRYKILTASDPTVATGVIVKDDVTTLRQIQLYDDVDALDSGFGVDYLILDESSLGAYQADPANLRFNIGVTYFSYTVTTPNTVDTSEIFGLKFSNIERPHPNVVGFYIVRNERLDDDRLILDTAIFGAMTKFNEYRSFGLINPKQYYPVNNCGRAETPTKVLQYDDKTVWFYNPEYHYLQDTQEFDKVVVEGVYEETSVNMPTECTGLNDTNMKFGTRGVYIDDVQAGTSFNPAVNKNKDKDDDGFDLIIGYRNTNVKFILNSSLVFPVKSRIIRLAATAHQNFGANIYYNVSTDNRISMLLTDGTFDTNIFYNTTTKKNSLVYGALERSSTSSYSNYTTRPYYKEHNNPIIFGAASSVSNVSIFGGDTQISATNLISTVFSNIVVATRAKKSRLLSIIAGAVLVVIGVLATIYTGGTSLALVGAGLGAMAISYGVSLAVSGFKFEQMKKMIDEDYEKGLRDTVTDGGVFETIRDNIGTNDDTIRWFSDRVSNIYMESRVPVGLRVGMTVGVADFMDAPALYSEEAFRSYLTEKLTIIDRDQGSGRLYKGFASAEFYDANKDYMRTNKEKIFIHLPLEYDCCSKQPDVFHGRVWYSEQSFQEELTDNYRVILPNNYKDIEGEHGAITDLYKLGDNLFIHTKEALWQLPASLQERVTGEIVSFIGTGSFFSVPPKKVVDSNLGSAGTSHKWATIKSTQGVMFVDEIEHQVYLHGAKLQDLSEGNVALFNEIFVAYLDMQLFRKYGINHVNNNNPANPNGTGYLSVLDTENNRIMITKRDYKILQAKLNILTRIDTVEDAIAYDGFAYCIEDGNFYFESQIIYLGDRNFFENKSFTLSFSFNKNEWQSFHTYIPNYYIQGQNNFFSSIFGESVLWRHNRIGNYQNFYDTLGLFIFEYVKVKGPLGSSVFEDITLQTVARKYNFDFRQFIEERYVTFNKILVYNERQSSGEQILLVRDVQPNPSQYLAQQTKAQSGQVLITRKGKDWNINGLRDYVNSYEFPLFSKVWEDIKNDYFIDKISNVSVIDFTKKWYDLESFKDKYLVVRLKFDNFDDVNLLLNYSIETEQSTNE